MMTWEPHRARELLRAGSGRRDAVFRDGQEEAIRHVVEGHGRLLVVQKTGWGKSFVYFIATKLLREAGLGPALLVSPLLSLMRNQVDAADRMGVRAARVTSDNENDWSGVEAAIDRDEIDILLVSPERFVNRRFLRNILSHVAPKLSLFVVDEAHCISDWGHDFRPDYRHLERVIRQSPASLRVLATTATANQRIMDDLAEVLGPNIRVLKGDLNRPSLALQTMRLPSQAERLAWLAAFLPELAGSGIVYTLTKRDAYRVASWLKSRGVVAEAYTSDVKNREELEAALLSNSVKALVATTSLGMGYDKPDLAFVIHFQAPGSVVAYYQQVGRAGRAISQARGILLCGEEDQRINDYFIQSAFPTRREVDEVLGAFEDHHEGLTTRDFLPKVNLTENRIKNTLNLLSLESPAPVTKQGSKWQLTAAPLADGFWERVERLTAIRANEQRQMQTYVDLTTGHMAFLVAALDGDASSITPPPFAPLPTLPPPALVQEAVAWLRRTSLLIEPRKRWPAGGLPKYKVRGDIDARGLAENGRALCAWGDPGWGELVRRGKYTDGRFSDELVAACARLVREWGPKPSWVTCVPSQRHPTLVPDFAARLAGTLGLPFKRVLAKVGDRPEQKSMGNSVHQARNLDGALNIDEQPLDGPVLLVDDMVDSRWTFTVAAALLRQAGSGPVYPLELAQTGKD